MKNWPMALIICATISASVVFAPQSSARRTYFTPEQKQQLQKAQTVYVNALALTEKGRTDPGQLQRLVSQRLQEIGFSVTADRTQVHDVEFKVKCEERKTWTGTTAAGGDAELPDAPARLWKGPACLLTYMLDGKNLGWYKEVRTSFQDAMQAAKEAGDKNAGSYALTKLAKRLEQYDFPVLLAAEWGQPDRLTNLLDTPDTPKIRKLFILSTLSAIKAEAALPHLTKLMRDKDLAQEAVEALTGVGEDSIPFLTDLFQSSTQPQIQAAAAKALGDVAGSSGNPAAIPPLLEYLKTALKNFNSSADINFPVLTEVVWSLGKLRDEDSLEPMDELNQKVWLIRDNSKEMAALREAANWTYKQLDLDGHVS
ncbi:MAG: HEAT repeat domain-containing protein [Nitrospira sp.]|nr:HEAT repeat domain-containing protein [Nitrospira sp.]